jgi:hypothetical protein
MSSRRRDGFSPRLWPVTVEKQVTDDMKAALPPGALAAMWAKLLNQAGTYKSCGTDPRVRRIDDKQMVITPCEFGRATIDIQFAFDGVGRREIRPIGAGRVPGRD